MSCDGGRMSGQPDGAFGFQMGLAAGRRYLEVTSSQASSTQVKLSADFLKTENIMSSVTRAAFAATFLLSSLVVSATAGEVKTGDLKISEPWIRVTIPGRPAAGYFHVHNMGGDADRVVSASSPSAKRIELHTHLMDGGVMKMRHVDAIDVPAKGNVELKPGGLHLMIFDLEKTVQAGHTMPVTVEFEKAGKVTLDFAVRKAGGHDSHGGSSDHGDHSGHSTHGTGSQ